MTPADWTRLQAMLDETIARHLANRPPAPPSCPSCNDRGMILTQKGIQACDCQSLQRKDEK